MRRFYRVMLAIAIVCWFGGCAYGAFDNHSGATNLGFFSFFAAWILAEAAS